VESVWLQVIFSHSKSVLLNFVYRTPNSNQSWVDFYEQQLITAELNNLYLYVTGDMNINYSYLNTFIICKWAHIVQDFGLEQLIQSPTRVTKDTSTIIDHLYVSSLNHIYDVSASNLSISDHFSLSFTINCVTRKETNAFPHKTIHYRSFKNFNGKYLKMI
jgi:hypothetical protein